MGDSIGERRGRLRGLEGGEVGGDIIRRLDSTGPCQVSSFNEEVEHVVEGIQPEAAT